MIHRDDIDAIDDATSGLAHWPADTSISNVDHTAATLLADVADRHPERLAVVGADHHGNPRRLTYRELWDRARAVARTLLASTDRGEHVAVLAHNVVEWPIIEYAVALSGRVLVALNPYAGEAELRYTLDHSDARILIYAPWVRDRNMAAVVAEIACGIVRLDSRDMSSVWKDSPDGAGDRTWPTLNTAEPAMLQYTSGTTGRQKGVLLSHRSVINAARNLMKALEVGGGSTSYSPFPQFHTAGCVTSNLGALAVEGTLVMADRWDPVNALDTIEREKVSLALLVPTMLDDLVKQVASRESKTHLPTILVGGAPVPESLIDKGRRAFDGEVLNVYGQTELSAPLTSTRPRCTDEHTAGTVGQPLPQVEVRLADPQSGRTVRIGEIGEICARGYQQMLGYYRDPDATAATVDNQGWLRTGDLATMDRRGNVSLVGRLKEMIIRGGENIAPAEVVECLLSNELVSNAAVFGLPDPRLGEIVAAALVIAPGRPQEDHLDEIDGYCRKLLAHYKVPQRWFVLESLPLTAAGKVRTLAVRQAVIDQEQIG